MLNFVQCAQAVNTYVETFGSLAVSNGNPLDVRQPTTLCSLFGMAYVVAELWPFSADITSYWHLELPLSDMDKALKKPKYDTIRSQFMQVCWIARRSSHWGQSVILNEVKNLDVPQYECAAIN